MATLPTLKPDILPFALLFSHETYPRYGGSLTRKKTSLPMQMLNRLTLADASTFAFDTYGIQRLFRDTFIQ